MSVTHLRLVPFVRAELPARDSVALTERAPFGEQRAHARLREGLPAAQAPQALRPNQEGCVSLVLFVLYSLT